MINLIGISGVSRCGKNTLATILSSYFENVKEVAFATKLKEELDPFIREKFGFSAFTENDEEKNQIRDLFVWYGATMRKRTNGRYWVEAVMKDINPFVTTIITDVRYENETRLIQEAGGKVIHLRRFDVDWLGEKIYKAAANKEEELNDPKVAAIADFHFEWPTFNSVYTKDKAKEELKGIVECLS